MKSYLGSCHCGAIRVEFRSARPASELGARRCQCSFCKLHGASWTSDPSGTVDILSAGAVGRYRQGTGTAEFLVCTLCGVIPAVIWKSGETLLSVVRVECLQEGDALAARTATTNFDAEQLDQRLARRAQRWTPAKVTIE